MWLAIEKLGLDRNEIDFEIVEAKKAGMKGGAAIMQVRSISWTADGRPTIGDVIVSR